MRPPMNDTVILTSVPVLDENGQPVTDDYGRPKRTKTESIARVTRTARLITNRSGQEAQAKLKISLPPETFVEPGFPVEWTDRFGQTIRSTVEVVEEVRNYSGLTVYYQTVYTV